MYEKFWGLKEKPFKNTPDPRFLCTFPQYRDSLMKLNYVIRENLGAGLLTGVFGCGKTLLVRSLINGLSAQKYRFANLVFPPSSGEEFLRSLVRSLRPSDLPSIKSELMEDALLESLEKVVTDNEREGRETIVIADEAHSITKDEIFERMRLLLNFQKDDRFLITLILVGQPELGPKVADLRQFDQRIAVKCHLAPLSEDETRDYILHRMKVAGREKEVFAPEVFPEIYQSSGGIPRRINYTCDLCLMTGFARQREKIDKAVFEESRTVFASGAAAGSGTDEA